MSVFEVTDPRGYKVICTEDCLNNHIHSNHPEMMGLEESIEQTVQEPTFGAIYQDSLRPERNIYYRLNETRSFYIKVVVEFDADNSGRVITAFRTSSPKSGEKLIWPQRSST